MSKTKLKFKQQKQKHSKHLGTWVWIATHGKITYRIEHGLAFWHVYKQDQHIVELQDKQECLEFCEIMVEQDK